MKVAFIDIDGVLVTFGGEPRYYEGTDMAFHGPCVVNLNALVARTGCRLVISSAWRLSEHMNLARIFREEGVIGEIVGKTPALGSRGEEILAWLRSAGGGISAFVAIDDMDLAEQLPGRCVKTRGRTGFDGRGLEEATRILGRPWRGTFRPITH